MHYQWDFGVVWQALPFLLQGLRFTVLVTILSMAGGLVLGLIVSLSRLSSWRALATGAQVYTEFFRGTPFLTQLFWMYYALPLTTGITLSPLVTGAVTGVLNLGAFCGEIFRAGILSVDRGQHEASLGLGMTRWQSMHRIVLPQAVRYVIPPLGSTWVSLFKDTSLLAAISVPELMYQGQVLAIQTYRPMEVYTTVAVIYLVVTYPQSRLVDALFRKLRVHA